MDNSDTAAPRGGVLPTASLVDVINSLYGSQTAGTHQQLQHQQHKWHELDQEGRPLMQASSAGAGPAARHQQQQLQVEGSAASSSGSCDPGPLVDAEAAAAGDYEQQQYRIMLQGQLEEGLRASQQQQNEQDLPSAESTCIAIEGSSSIAQPKCTQFFESAEGDSLLPEDSKQEVPAQGCSTKEQEEATREPSAPAEAEAVPADSPTADTAQGSASVYLTEVEGLLAKRAELQAELSGYVQQLTSMADEEGQQLVDMPADYNLMVGD